MRIVLFALLAISTAASAKNPPVAPCSKYPHYRDFDFWIGTWDITGKNNKIAGHNTIERALGGCAVLEHWTGASGTVGTSVNYYDPARHRWHQSWVDDSGDIIELDGVFANGAMVLEGPYTHADGSVTRLRGTWTTNADGSVRQLFEESSDGGATWSVWFDGKYAKTK